MRPALLDPVRALEMVLEQAGLLEEESVPLVESPGRILSRGIDAPTDLPPFDRSAMDGFAVRSADLAAGAARLRIAGEIPAGAPAEPPVRPGEAVRIMTGAPIPPGADAVQMVERTTTEAGSHFVTVSGPVAAGEHIRFRGDDLKTGARVLEAGQRIRASEIALLATFGIANPHVRRAPRTALLSTGDELVEPDRTPLPHEIRNSNSPALAAVLKREGLPFEYLGIARDEIDDLRARIRRGLEFDVLCLSGGVSMGERDLVGEALAAEGVEVLFHKVAIKPGKPILFGVRKREGGGRTLVFGLPGNPLSSVCDFALFALPALRAMQGEPDPRPREMTGILESPMRQHPGRAWYALAEARWSDDGWRVSPVSSTGSADMAAACRANAYAVMPAEASELPAGARVRLLLWEGGLA